MYVQRPSFIQLESKVCMKVTSTGTLTGFMYWFILHFPNGETISTGLERAGEVREREGGGRREKERGRGGRGSDRGRQERRNSVCVCVCVSVCVRVR